MTTAVSPEGTPALWAALVDELELRCHVPLAQDREAASHAFARLSAAMEHHRPSCQGDDRFTTDETRRGDTAALAAICATCPLAATCLAYAETANPAAGYWAGHTWTTTEKQGDNGS